MTDHDQSSAAERIVAVCSAAVAVLRIAELEVRKPLFNVGHVGEWHVSVEAQIKKQLRRDLLTSLDECKQSCASRFEAVP